MTRDKSLPALGLGMVFGFGVALVLAVGREGYMPLDQSIVFDGGWRTLCGQVVYRDYATPNAIVPSWLQAGFFAVCGVSWFTYVLHAAIANGVFGLLVVALLRNFDAPRGLALAYGALACVFFYPPFGVPYMEQHAFLFALAGIVLALAAVRAEPGSKRELACWTLVPVAFVAGWLSKQIPTGFAAPLVLAVLAAAGRARWRRGLVAMAAGTLATLAVLGAWALAVGVDWSMFATYHLRLPAEEGAYKQRFLRHPGAIVERLMTLLETGNVVALWLAPLAAIACAAGVALARRAGVSARAQGAALTALGLIAVTLAFIAHTGNQWQNGIPLAIPAFGLVHAALELAARELPAGRRRAALALRVAGALILIAAVRDAWVFQRDVNRTRTVDDLVFDTALADETSSDLPVPLAFLRWSVPWHYSTRPAELDLLVRTLREAPGDFLLLGDMSVLYGVVGKPSAMPVLWLHPGLTFPWPRDPARADFEERLVRPILDGRVRRIVLEGETTWTRRTLAEFPRLAEIVRERGAETRKLGFFRIVELAPR